MKAYSTASGGVIFVPDTVDRKQDGPVSYKDLGTAQVIQDEAGKPLTGQDMSHQDVILKRA